MGKKEEEPQQHKPSKKSTKKAWNKWHVVGALKIAKVNN